MMTRTMGREPARSSTHEATHVHLKDEDAALRRSTETNYKSKVGNKLLKVEQIWYFIKFHVANPDVQHTKYMKAAIAGVMRSAPGATLLESTESGRMCAARESSAEPKTTPTRRASSSALSEYSLESAWPSHELCAPATACPM